MAVFPLFLLSACIGGGESPYDLGSVEPGTVHQSVKYGACYEAALGEAWDFNLFVFGDVTQPSADTQGRVVVGGNAYFGNYSIGEILEADASRLDLIVGGSLQFPSGAVLNGAASYGTTAEVTQAASFFGGLTQRPAPIDVPAVRSYLTSLSDRLAALQPNSAALFNPNENARFETVLAGHDPLINVFSITGETLERTHTLRISAPASSTVLVNVSGSAAAFHSKGLFVEGVNASRILYNFAEATSLYIGEIQIEGSILAPRADVLFPAGLVIGHLISQSLYGQGQNNKATFWGCLPNVCDDGSCENICKDGNCGEEQKGCTLTIGYWKNHLGVLSLYLPKSLGTLEGLKSLPVSTTQVAYDVLGEHTYGTAENGITKLYAQLLAAKLNVSKGASDSSIAEAVLAADAFLASHSYLDWGKLSPEIQAQVLEWKTLFDDFNNGLVGPPHCD